jgi:hypothetical protein
MQVRRIPGRLLTLLILFLASNFYLQRIFAQDICKSLAAELHDLEVEKQQAEDELHQHTCTGTAKPGCIKQIRDLGNEISAVQKRLEKECPPGHGVFDPPFYLITILYASPGNQSEVNYGNGSTTGSRSELKPTVQFGVQLQYSTPGAELDVGYQYGNIDGHFFETKKETSKTLTLTSQLDRIDHSKDMFYLWMNPEVTIDRPSVGAPATVTLQVKPGQPMRIVNLTAEELQDPSKIPANKKPLVAGLQPADLNKILSADPFVSGVPLDADRYIKVDTLQLDGPDQPGDPISGNGLKVSNETESGSIEGSTHKVTATLLVGFDFLGTGSKIGGGFEWDYENTTEKIQEGHAQEIEVILRSSTVNYHDVVDVYMDTMFNSFAYVSTVASPTARRAPDLSGTVKDRNGRPAFNSLVTVTAPDGTRRRVFTNARGIYRVFGLGKRSGKANVSVGAQKQQVTLNAQNSAVLDFETH